MNQSEVARLRQQIALEYEAAQRALTGMAITARHDFITARMERIAEYHQELVKEVGSPEAIRVVYELANESIQEAQR
jgi:hypothetical protein